MFFSRSRGLIFIKTKKTAGTSVEAYLEVACDPRRWTGEWEDLHVTDGEVTHDLIVTARGDGTRRRGERSDLELNGVRLVNHMTPSRVIAALGRDTWDSSLTVAGVRNPWDRMASMFFWSRRRDASREELLTNPEQAREAFVEFLGGWQREQADDEIMSADLGVDEFIRYEHLEADLGRVFASAGIERPGIDMPRLKAGSRPEGYTWLYDDGSRARVAEIYADMIERFGYTF
jgi:hypothetical protein